MAFDTSPWKICVATHVSSLRDAITPTSVTQLYDRLPLLLLPLLRAATSAATTAALVFLARDASVAPVLRMSVRRPSMISVVFTAASVVQPTQSTVTTMYAVIVVCSLTSGQFHTALCDAAGYDLNAPSSSTVPTPVGTTGVNGFTPPSHNYNYTQASPPRSASAAVV